MGRKELKIKIQELPNLERPYEKLEQYGSEILSNAELLAIVIKTGTRNSNSVEIAQKLLTNNKYKQEGFRFLYDISINELTKYEGIGKVKAIQLKAIAEIMKRSLMPTMEETVTITNTADIAKIAVQKLKYEKNEKIFIALLNTKGHLKTFKQIKDGGINSIEVKPMEIFKDAIKEELHRVILIHNHPSGDPKPSMQDILFTKNVIKAGQMLGIEILDHIVIGDGKFESIMKYI